MDVFVLNFVFLALVILSSGVTLFFSKRKEISALDIAAGATILIILSFCVFWIGIPKLGAVLFIVSVLIGILAINFRRNVLFWRSRDFVNFLTFYCLAGLFFSIGNNFRYKMYVNPDVVGYAAVSASLKEHGSYPNVLSKWSQETGKKFNFDFDWNQPTPLLDSPWNVASESVKYAADVIYFQRTGVSSLISLFTPDIQLYRYFPIAWNAVGLFSIVVMAQLLLKVNLELLSLVKLGKKNRLLEFDLRPWKETALLGSLMVLIYSSLGIRTLFLEGFVPHLYSYLLIILFVYLILILKRNRISELTLAMVICYVGLHIIYLQMVIFLLGIISFFLFSYVWSQRKTLRVSKTSIPIFSFFALLFLEFNMPGVRYLVFSIQGQSGHGAVHLGLPKINDFIGFLPSTLSMEAPTLGKGVTIFSNSAFNINTQYLGYEPLLSAPEVIFLWIGIVVACLVLILVLTKHATRAVPYLAFNGLYVLYILFYFISHTSFALSFGAISDYVWLRLNSLSGVLILSWLPALGIALWCRFSGTLFRTSSILLSALILFSGMFSSVNSLVSFSKLSKSFTVSRECPIIDSSSMEKKMIMTMDDSSFYATPQTLFLCDARWINLRDSYASVHDLPAGTEVTLFTYSASLESWGYRKIGRLRQTTTVTAPCDSQCVSNIPSFEPIQTDLGVTWLGSQP